MVNTRFVFQEDSDSNIIKHAEALHIICHRNPETGLLGATWQLHGNIMENDGTPGDDATAFARRLLELFTKGGEE